MTMPFRLSAVAGLILLGAMANAGAEATTDRYGKELKIEPARNFFARFGVLGLKLNNKSEAAKDVSGPVLSGPANANGPTAGDRSWQCNPLPVDSNGDPVPICDPANSPPTSLYVDVFGNRIDPEGSTVLGQLFHGTGVTELGLPENVKARIADPLPGAIGTLGMYFDEDHHWAIEAPIMALPFSLKIYGAGSFQNAGQIASGKALGLLVFGHYYFGKKTDKFRPAVSLTANYLLPFDLQATPELERWTGGVTKISSKGSLGLGWMVGGKYELNDRWDLNVHVGQFKAKVDNVLTTYDTRLTQDSPLFTYWPGQLGANLRALRSGSVLRGNLNELMAYRNADVANRVNGGANLGNFTRTQRQTLDPYVMMMSVGYNF
ncbi:OmpW family outer membrane protein [Aquabacterium sp.]|uniref:OmpW family outer membrane protein n=1 Tax=Aquabacterium sp. TaxID=1872578 RepID=UPI003D6DA2E7